MAIFSGTAANHAAAMRRQAEVLLRQRQRRQSQYANPESKDDHLRLLHELQVHQIELEMQNAELQDARERTDVLLEKYTDLYDFAPIGYFTLDDQGRVLEVNLTGASLLGIERSRLLSQRLSRSLTPASHADFFGFLRRLFADEGQQACEVALVRGDGSVFWASLHGSVPDSADGPQATCRVVVSDLTALRQAEEAQRRLEALAASILALEQEVAQHKATEGSLEKAGRHHLKLLAQSRHMQTQLRHLSHEMMTTQDDEHRQISKELYAVISQALAGIGIRLEVMRMGAAVGSDDLDGKITSMKQMVEDSMGLVEQFSNTIHPTVLDDLGLIPALRSYVQAFSEQTGLNVELHAVPGVERLNREKKTALFHVVLEALALVIRDKRTSQVQITLDRKDGGARLLITGNRVPAPRATRSRGKGGSGLVLLGMQERLEMVGGSFTVESIKGVGTTMTACIPFGKTVRAVSDDDSTADG